MESASCTNSSPLPFHFEEPTPCRCLCGRFSFLDTRGCASIPLATLVIALLQILGVPVSREKIQFGHKVDYLGWSISSRDGKFWALMSTDKLQRLLRWIAWWRGHSKKVQRCELQAFLGLLIWGAQLRLHLRAFAAPVFHCLYRPSTKRQLLRMDQIVELASVLDAQTLRVLRNAERSDVQGWTLRDIGGRPGQEDRVTHLTSPKLKNGKAWVRFSALGPHTNLDAPCLAALGLIERWLSHTGMQWACGAPNLVGAADAWADAHMLVLAVGCNSLLSRLFGSIWSYADMICLQIGSGRQN